MQKNIILALFLLGLISISAWGKSPTKKQFLPDTAVRHRMNTISGSIRDLGPYIASESEFTKDKNKNIIEKKLLELGDLFKNLKNHQVIETKGLSLNQSLMSEQLDQTVTLFKSGKRSLAHAKFTAALNLCVSCHTQSPGLSLPKLFADKEIDKMKLSSFERAELFFISRDYTKAIELYDQFLLKSKKTDDDELLFKALERQLIYFVRIEKNFQAAKNHFQKYLKAKLFNQKLNDEISEWVESLSQKTLWDNYDPQTVKEEEMDKFMKGFIADDEEGPIFTITNSSEVYDLNLSSILLDYYNTHPDTKLGGRILYWLAVLDRRINDDLFYSLGDVYLISCMEKYSKDPIALECYDTYVEDLEINFMSKDKKEFPAEIKDRLNRLRKLIDYKDAP